MVRNRRIRYIPTPEDYHNSLVYQIPVNEFGPTLPPGVQPLPPPVEEECTGAPPGTVIMNAEGIVLSLGTLVPRSLRVPGGTPCEAVPVGNPPTATEPAPGGDLANEEGAGLAPEFLPGNAVNAPTTVPGDASAANLGSSLSPDPGAAGPSAGAVAPSLGLASGALRVRPRRPVSPPPVSSDDGEYEEDYPEPTQLEQLEQRNRDLEAAVAQRDAALASVERRLSSLEGNVAAAQNTVAALRREVGGPSRPASCASVPTVHGSPANDHSDPGGEPTTNCLWCGLDGHWVPDCPKKAAGLTPEQAQRQLGTLTLVRKLREAIAAKRAAKAKRPASNSGRGGSSNSRGNGGGSGKRGRPGPGPGGPGSGPGPSSGPAAKANK